jgi:glycosyltransferase involved in cell wall biosynthesis
MNIVPVLLIKNEELWIRHVLASLVHVFPHVIVADTGSTDSTLEQIAPLPNITLQTFDHPLTPRELGQCRGEMQQLAKSLFDATHIFLVDGDELYPTKYLRFLVDNPMPENAMSGFTWGIECTELPNGECWLYAVGLNRQAIISVDSKWKGEYPFESPSTYIPGHPSNHYWKSPDPTYHFYHLHQMRRSIRDDDVYLRKQKQFQFSMADHPEIKPATLWLKSREDYVDE